MIQEGRWLYVKHNKFAKWQVYLDTKAPVCYALCWFMCQWLLHTNLDQIILTKFCLHQIILMLQNYDSW